MDFDYMYRVGGGKPSGTLEITENGEYDVTEYAGASVNVAGSQEGESIIDSFISGMLSGEYVNNTCTIVKNSAFEDLPNVTSVKMNAVEMIKSYAFRDSRISTCEMKNLKIAYMYSFQRSLLTIADFERLENVTIGMFSSCKMLTSARFHSARSVGDHGFESCVRLKTVDMPGGGSIGSRSFSGCSNIEIFVLRDPENVTSLSSDSGLAGRTQLSIYVPDNLVDSYKAATNWSEIADRIKPLSEYVEEV